MFDADDDLSNADELTLERFRELGVPTELTDNIADSYEYIGPGGILIAGGTAPLSAHIRVQRCIGWLDQTSRKAALKGANIRAGRSTGKASVVHERNARAIAFMNERFCTWRQGKLTRQLLSEMVWALKLGPHIRTSPDALEKFLRREKLRCPIFHGHT